MAIFHCYVSSPEGILIWYDVISSQGPPVCCYWNHGRPQRDHQWAQGAFQTAIKQWKCGAKLEKMKEHLPRCPPTKMFCYASYSILLFFSMIHAFYFSVCLSFGRQLKENPASYPRKTTISVMFDWFWLWVYDFRNFSGMFHYAS